MHKCSVKCLLDTYIISLQWKLCFLCQLPEMCRIDWMHKHVAPEPKQEESHFDLPCLYESKHRQAQVLDSPTPPMDLFPSFNCGCSSSWNNQDSHHSSRTDPLCLQFCTNVTIRRMFSLDLSKCNKRQIKQLCCCCCFLISWLERRW